MFKFRIAMSYMRVINVLYEGQKQGVLCTVHEENKGPITVHGNTSLRPSYICITNFVASPVLKSPCTSGNFTAINKYTIPAKTALTWCHCVLFNVWRGNMKYKYGFNYCDLLICVRGEMYIACYGAALTSTHVVTLIKEIYSRNTTGSE